jgi:predicted enzyme related to lactoylglutathione lyase
LASADIDADFDFLVSQGVEVVSEPVNVHTSETSYARFFCFKDPDGTFLELVQVITKA